MHLEDLESYRKEEGGDSRDIDDDDYSYSHSKIHKHVTKAQLFLYGFCTGIVSQIIVFGFVDLFFGNSIIINSTATTTRGEATSTTSTSSSSGNGNEVYVVPSSSKVVEQWTFTCALIAICFTSCLGVFYILSFMPIFRQPARRIRIRILRNYLKENNDNGNNNNISDNDDVDDYAADSDYCDYYYDDGATSSCSRHRRCLRSVILRLNAIDTYFSLGHLVS